MGEMNLLQSKWDGKVGQLVGAKWKNKATVHAYTKPTDAKSQSQLKQREWYKVAQRGAFLFAQELRGLTNISYKNMGLGNALMKYNKDNVDLTESYIFFYYQFARANEQTIQSLSPSGFQPNRGFTIEVKPQYAQETDIEYICVQFTNALDYIEVTRGWKAGDFVKCMDTTPDNQNIHCSVYGRKKIKNGYKYYKTFCRAYRSN